MQRRRGWMLALLVAMAPAGAFAQPQAVPGMHVTMEPPAGFIPAQRFAGFQREEAQASIMVTEVPAPFSTMETRLTPESFAAEGMQFRGADSVTVDGMRGRLISVAQQARGMTYEKWALMFGNDSLTVIVTATWPREHAASLREPLRRAVLSTRWAGAAPEDPLAGLGFAVDAGSRLRVARRFGNMLLLNDTGTLPNATPGSPLLMVGRSVAPADLRDMEAFAQWRLRQARTVSGISGISGAAVTIDGAQGYEIVADAVDTESGTPLGIYQVVLAEGTQYLLIQAMVGADRAEVFIPEFQAIARSLRRTR
ncbi:MAG TPA: hypothetical protein VHG93_03995 [Longimicrobium sp.]|nr:hypothetical protein [Longimicrobium sp.]